MEIGIIINLLNLVLLLGVDIVAHDRNTDLLNCMFIFDGKASPVFTPLQISCILVTQQILSALSTMLIYISYFEFICAQSPHSMKGMLIGLSYAIKGFFNLMGTILILSFYQLDFPSCGFGYYSMNVMIGVITFVTFVKVSKRYKYRERDEPSKEREYAENYYSNPNRENIQYPLNWIQKKVCDVTINKLLITIVIF